MEFTQNDRDLIIRHDVKMCEVRKDIKTIKGDMKDGLNKIMEKLDTAAVACPTNRANCRKEVDKEIDTKMSRKVDWKYFGGVIALISIIITILKYGVT